MTEARDPRRKKELELKRDHRVLPLQGDKTLRKAWPRKKARANRKVRRAEAIALAQPDDPEVLEQKVRASRARRRRKLRKQGVVTLQQHLAVQQWRTLRWSELMNMNKEARAALSRRAKARATPGSHSE